jgi:hypothetical protein
MKTTKKLYSRRFLMRAAAAVPRTLTVEFQGQAEVVAAEAKEGGKKGPPTFSMVAYNGGPIRPHLDPPLPHPVVVDLAGMSLTRQQYPALKDHDQKKLVGHTDAMTTDGRKLEAAGIISGAGADANEVVMAAGNGFKWPVSLGAALSKVQLLKAGDTARINGRDIVGPVYIARASRPREVSFLTLAADDDAEATIAASSAEDNAMTYEEWLKLKKLQRAKLSEAQTVTLQAAFKADQSKNGQDEEIKAMVDATVEAVRMAAGKETKEAGDAPPKDDARKDGGIEELKVELKATIDGIKRSEAVRRLCGEKHVELAASAVEKGWDDDTIKLAIEAAELKAQLPKSMQIRTGKPKDAPADNIVLEAACAMAGKLNDVEKVYDERVLNAAAERFRHGISLQELLLTAAQANGYTGNSVRQDIPGVLRAAFTMQAASVFSTVSLPGIFANVANKFLLEGFTFVESVWRMIAAIRSVTDFKTITSYRMTGDGEFEEVGPGGEIKHGTLGEESFTNRARSYGKMFGITFQDIKNDDLGVVPTLGRKLGRGGALKLNSMFWTTFLDNASFFADPSQNFLKGATTTLTTVGLALAHKKFLDKVDADSKPLSVEPAILLVPPALEVAGMELMSSLTFNTGGSATTVQVASKNIWANKYRLVMSRYLGNAAITGFSDTAYYLLPDPRDIPVMEVCFLDGQEQPTIETADADFNTLGIQMRGTLHFGVAKQDARGGLKVKGAA